MVGGSVCGWIWVIVGGSALVVVGWLRVVVIGRVWVSMDESSWVLVGWR